MHLKMSSVKWWSFWPEGRSVNVGGKRSPFISRLHITRTQTPSSNKHWPPPPHPLSAQFTLWEYIVFYWAKFRNVQYNRIDKSYTWSLVSIVYWLISLFGFTISWRCGFRARFGDPRDVTNNPFLPTSIRCLSDWQGNVSGDKDPNFSEKAMLIQLPVVRLMWKPSRDGFQVGESLNLTERLSDIPVRAFIRREPNFVFVFSIDFSIQPYKTNSRPSSWSTGWIQTVGGMKHPRLLVCTLLLWTPVGELNTLRPG